MTTSRALIAASRRASRSDATRTTCSHFAPITSRNRAKQEQERRINRKHGTACCRTLFPQDQRVTGHGRVVLYGPKERLHCRVVPGRRDSKRDAEPVEA